MKRTKPHGQKRGGPKSISWPPFATEDQKEVFLECENHELMIQALIKSCGKAEIPLPKYCRNCPANCVCPYLFFTGLYLEYVLLGGAE